MGKSKRSLTALLALAIAMTACGSSEPVDQPDLADPSAPLIHVSSIGGFVPVEFNLNRGPTFTVTQGGSFIFAGAQTMEYPGPALPHLREAQLSDDDMQEIRRLLDEMGIADITEEHDDSVVNVADASTEVIEFYDAEGVHEYSVYALGITDQPASQTTAKFLELFNYLHELAATIQGDEYEADQVQVIASADYEGPDPDFIDIRPWPLEGEDPLDWDELTRIGEDQVWSCKTFDASVLEVFSDATQATVWMDPTESGDAQNYQLLVRPLHPGEDGCPVD
jgi:predicted small lipoprotein YifL